MKVYSRVTWQWIDGKLVELPDETFSYEYEGPIALAGSASFSLSAYRFYEDDGSESASTALGTQSTNTTVNVATDHNLTIRVRAQESGGGAGATTDDWAIQHDIIRQATLTYIATSTSSTHVQAFASSFLTDAGTTTNRLGAGTGSFVAGEISEVALITDRQITANNFSELVFTIKLLAAHLFHGDQIIFRITRNAGIVASTAIPTLTIDKTSSGFGGLKGTLRGAAASLPSPALATGSVSVSVGDLVYVQFSHINNLSTGVTDNLGNTYSPVNAGSDPGSAAGRAYYSCVTVAGTLTQCDIAVSGTAATAWSGSVAVYEGPFDSSPLDANPANGVSDVTSPYDWPSTGTLAQADELVIGSLACNAGPLGTNPTLAVTSPWRGDIAHGEAIAAATAASIILSRVVAATTSVAPQLTSSTNPTAIVLTTASFKKASGATAWSGAGTFAGSGTLSVNATKSKLAAATFSGAGSLSARVDHYSTASAFQTDAFQNDAFQITAGGVTAHSGAATFAGAGSLSAAARQRMVAGATFAGAGQLSAYATLRIRIAATFQGAGNLTADATKAGFQSAEATFAGTGALSVATSQRMAIAAIFAGAGSLSVAAAKSKTAEATFQGAGQVSAYGALRMVVAATFQGAGSLVADATQAGIKFGAATFAGAGSLTAAAALRMPIAASFQGAGQLSAYGALRMRIVAQFAGAGALTANASVVSPVTVWQASARFAGSGKLYFGAAHDPDAWWNFVTNAVDATGHGYDGTLHGTSLTTDPYGRPARLFNGTTDYIDGSTSPLEQ